MRPRGDRVRVRANEVGSRGVARAHDKGGLTAAEAAGCPGLLPEACEQGPLPLALALSINKQ